MLVICERCCHLISRGEMFVRLGVLTDVDHEGQPVFSLRFLHIYDPATGACRLQVAQSD